MQLDIITVGRGVQNEHDWVDETLHIVNVLDHLYRLACFAYAFHSVKSTIFPRFCHKLSFVGISLSDFVISLAFVVIDFQKFLQKMNES